MATRRSVAKWNALSDSQRKRYVSAGRTGTLTGTAGLTPAEVRAYYLRGGDLSSGRGFHPAKNAAPRKATQRSTTGAATTSDLRALKKWRKSNAPKWIPKSASVMGDDTAAILSQLGLSPRYWKDVTIQANADGSFTMRVTSKRSSKVREIVLPDSDSLAEVRNLFNQYARESMAPNKRERDRLNREWQNASGSAFSIGFEIAYGTVREDSRPAPAPTASKALPRKRK